MSGWRGAVMRVTDPLGWRVKRIPVGARLAEFREQQWDDPDVWDARRSERLARLLIHASTRVPFYRERAAGLTPDAILADPAGSLRSFPVLTRDDLTERFDDLRCEMGRGTVPTASGGSTGMPVRFLHDRQYTGAALATTQLSFDWAGVFRGDRRVDFWAARRDFAGRHSIVRRVSNFVYDREVLNAYRMGDDEMRSAVDLLNRRPPVSLGGYARALFALAEFIEEEGLAVRSPRVVQPSAGTVYPHMRETLERVFRAPVFDRYGTREVGLMAAECDRHAGLHEIGETTILEVVDDHGLEVGPGEVGEVLVTNLWNYTMPLIRYAVSDDAVWSGERCSCGRPYALLARVVGRTGARFVRSDGGTTLPDFFIRLLGVDFNTGDVRKFQFVQEEIDRITVRIVPRRGSTGPSPDAREKITARIEDAMGGPCRVDFVIEDEIPPTASGKHFYTVSKVGRS